MPKRKEKPTPSNPQAEILAVKLVDTRIEFDVEHLAETNFRYMYSAKISRPEKEETGTTFFLANIRISKLPEDIEGELAAFTANYGCSFRLDSADRELNEAAAISLAQTTIWSSFSALAALVTDQMGVSFPILPPSPGDIDIEETPSEMELDD